MCYDYHSEEVKGGSVRSGKNGFMLPSVKYSPLEAAEMVVSMALQFILGNSGSGKSHFLYQHIIEES